MSNYKAERDSQIQELLPKLVKHLTGYSETSTYYKRCLEYATSKVRNQNELAVNGHEVQRRVDAVCEKFAVSNYQLYSDLLKKWKEDLASHPVIAGSGQMDIHWAILQLILDVARKPIEAITDRVIKNNGVLVEFPLAVDEPEESPNTALIDSLLETNHSVERTQNLSDDLSDWSDEEDSSSTSKDIHEEIREVEEAVVLPISRKFSSSLKPPQKESPYSELTGSEDSEQFLRETAQHNWWNEERSRTAANSSFSSADFAQSWNKYLDSLSHGLILDKNLSTTSEYMLMREIIWMLICPAKKCKFFRIEDRVVHLNSNVSTTSCSLPIIQSFLGKITGSLSNLISLRSFVDSVKEATKGVPMTYKILSDSILDHIQALEEFALETETTLMDQNDAMTSLSLIEKLQENHFQIIDALHEIVKAVILPEWQQTPSFVSSVVLLTKLWEYLECPLRPMTNNLGVSLLVPLLRSFLSVFDSWWTLGRLHDFSEEFLITEWGEERPLPDRTRKCPLIRLLAEHCRESNTVLTHLSYMNRSHILNEVNVPQSSYESFLADFLAPFKIPVNATDETQTESPAPTNEYYCELMELLQLDEQMKAEHRMAKNEVLSSLGIFKLFQSSYTNFSLPFLDLIIQCLDRLIRPRIEGVQNRVAKIFLEEYKIVNHFRNVHLVVLLESPAMYDFYTDVFLAIETDYNNLSSHQLTAKLESCLNAVHPKMEQLFTVEIDPHYYKTELDTILDCLTKIKVEYNFRAGEGVIDFNSTSIYNQTFQFLLQIKWGLWLLENLKFSDHLVRVKFFKQPNMLDYSIRRMGILRFWLLSSVKNIHSYLMHNVIESETLRLEKDLGKCTSIAKIQKCHQEFLENLEEKCFLTVKQAELRAVIQELLHFILIFRDIWLQLHSLADRDHQLDQKESKSILLEIKLDKLEGTYKNIHECLAEKLLEETRHKNDGNVVGLRDAFFYKQPSH